MAISNLFRVPLVHTNQLVAFRDPGMRLLLEQMSQDPGAVREHLQNPDILRKLMKLREAGIIKLR